MSDVLNDWTPILDVPWDERPDVPLVYINEAGMDLCYDCAEDDETVEYGIPFYNWQSIRHNCHKCGKRFVLEEDEDE